MINFIFNWLNRNKDKDNILVMVLKVLYKISTDWVHSALVLVLAWAFANYCHSVREKNFVLFIIVTLVVEIWFGIVHFYKNYKSKVQTNSDLILNEIIVAMTALDDYVNNKEDNGKGIFEYASNLVTFSMYKVLKEVTGCEVRISVIQQFQAHNSKRKCMMISRKSKKRTNCSKEKIDVDYLGKNTYYFLKILGDNEDNYIFFDTKEEINKKFYWKNKKRKSEIFQYIGLAEKIETSDVAFLLQIDGMDKNAFGKNKNELSVFTDNYIYPYIQFLRHAYNVDRKIKKGGNYEKK